MIVCWIILVYAILMLGFLWAFLHCPEWKPAIQPVDLPKYSYSIVLPCRNPGKNLDRLLEQLVVALDLEVLIIDDFSVPGMAIKDYPQVRIESLRDHSPQLSGRKNNKKEAIALGVSLAKGDYVICLDADVEVSKGWWMAIRNYIQTYSPKFLAGIHRYHRSDTLLSQFLSLEQDVLTAFSIGSLRLGFPTMCNGANMAFEKKTFLELGGYNGLYHIAGGDDLFLYHRVHQKFPEEVHYMKSLEGAVSSDPPATWSQLAAQRRRWLGKTGHYENPWMLPVAALILIANTICLSLPLCPGNYWMWVGALLKVITDMIFIQMISRFFRMKISLIRRIIFVLIYPVYPICLLLGIESKRY